MVRLLVVSSAALLAFASWSGCGGANSTGRDSVAYEVPAGPPVELAVDRPFYVAGETFEWSVSLRGIVGGEASMAMGDPGSMGGKPVIIVTSQVRSAGALALIKDVRDNVTSWIDLGSGLPLRHRAELKFGDKESRISTEFEDEGYRLDYERVGRTRYQRFHRLAGAVAHDGHSIIGVLRAWEPDDGARAYFYVLSGRRLWRNDVVFVGREVIDTMHGATPTVRIDGIGTRLTAGMSPDTRKKPRSYTVWITDDANRVPIKVTAHTEYGDVNVDLTRYERPERRVVWR